jgi:ribosome maturation protein SDO1
LAQTTARITKAGKHFEVLVDLDAALAYKKGDSNDVNFLEIDKIFTDAKKGEAAPSGDLKSAFSTEDVYEIAGQIVKSGEVLVSQEHRDEEKDQKFKQVVEFLVTNSSDPQTGNPHTADRIRSALDQAHVNVKNKPIDTQIGEIVEALSKVLPIKIETKKVKITIPAIHTGQAYGVVNQYKESETWKDNGDLEILVNVPAGIIIDFYEKLNGVTHGSALSEEIKKE